jgi:hypothetical protein
LRTGELVAQSEKLFESTRNLLKTMKTLRAQLAAHRK